MPTGWCMASDPQANLMTLRLLRNFYDTLGFNMANHITNKFDGNGGIKNYPAKVSRPNAGLIP